MIHWHCEDFLVSSSMLISAGQTALLWIIFLLVFDYLWLLSSSLYVFSLFIIFCCSLFSVSLYDVYSVFVNGLMIVYSLSCLLGRINHLVSDYNQWLIWSFCWFHEWIDWSSIWRRAVVKGVNDGLVWLVFIHLAFMFIYTDYKSLNSERSWQTNQKWNMSSRRTREVEEEQSHPAMTIVWRIVWTISLQCL